MPFVRSCLLTILIKCLKGHKSLGSLCFVLCFDIGVSGCKSVSDKVTLDLSAKINIIFTSINLTMENF